MSPYISLCCLLAVCLTQAVLIFVLIVIGVDWNRNKPK